MTLLTRDHSLSHPPLLKTEKIPVPEFGEDVELAVRGLTARQRWEFGQLASKSGDDEAKGPEPTSALITMAAIGGDGKLLYQLQDSDVIAEWPGDLVGRVGDVIMKMSGLSPDKGRRGKRQEVLERLRADPERQWAHRIARDLGCTVDELGDRMSSEEFGDWIAFYTLEHEAQEVAQAEDDDSA